MKTNQLRQFPFLWVAITVGMMMMVDLYIRPLKQKSTFPNGPKAYWRLMKFQLYPDIYGR